MDLVESYHVVDVVFWLRGRLLGGFRCDAGPTCQQSNRAHLYCYHLERADQRASGGFKDIHTILTPLVHRIEWLFGSRCSRRILHDYRVYGHTGTAEYGRAEARSSFAGFDYQSPLRIEYDSGLYGIQVILGTLLLRGG